MTTHKQVRSTEEALTLALEALDYPHWREDMWLPKRDSAITAIKAAIEAHKALMSQSTTWRGLTDEETAELVHRYAFYELTRQIEAKLKEKNTK